MGEHKIYLSYAISLVLLLQLLIFVFHWPLSLSHVICSPCTLPWKSLSGLTKHGHYWLTALAVICPCIVAPSFHSLLCSTTPVFCMLHRPFRDGLNQETARTAFKMQVESMLSALFETCFLVWPTLQISLPTANFSQKFYWLIFKPGLHFKIFFCLSNISVHILKSFSLY